jgi:hypothetical protein
MYWLAALAGLLYMANLLAPPGKVLASISDLLVFGFGSIVPAKTTASLVSLDSTPIPTYGYEVLPTSTGDTSRMVFTAVRTAAVVANVPQLFMTILYMSYNDLFTRMLLGNEWASYATERKSLRVSAPTGEQRSTHFLTLPYRHSVPLLIASVLLHWLVSRTLFVVQIYSRDFTSGVEVGLNATYVQFSPLALILVLVVLGLLLLILWAVGHFVHYPDFVTLVRSVTLATSAACHSSRGVEIDRQLAEKKLMWGDVDHDEVDEDGTVVGHATFSAGCVAHLVEGKKYR